MIGKLRPRPTYANVMATVAVFIALGGGAYAAHTHRMGTNDLRNRAVTAPKVANRAVAPRTIRRGAVRPATIRTNAVRARHLADGAVTRDGLASSAVGTGQIGRGAVTRTRIATGAISSSKIGGGAVTASELALTVRQGRFEVPNGRHRSRVVSCRSGETVIGGGGYFGGTFNDAQAEGAHFVYSGPVGSATAPGSWGVRVYNGSGGTRTLTIRAFCIDTD